jgi:protein-arginine kinase
VGKDCEGMDHKVRCRTCYEKKFGFHAAIISHNAASTHIPSEPRAKENQATAGKWDWLMDKLDSIRKDYPENRTAKYLTRSVFNSYSPKQQEFLYLCARSGVENPDSGIGSYAMRPNDYKEFASFFDPLIRDYHRASCTDKHITDWDASAVGNNGVLDVSELGLSELSMRVRVGRNLKRFNLPGAMTKTERIEFENSMLEAFDKLIAMPEFGGRVYSLTPDFDGKANPNLISQEEYQRLIDEHIMFKDMSADPYLKSAGIANDWPYGRGCYVSADGQVIVWMGEEDQLRIMCMKKGTKLNEVFDRLHSVLETIEKIPGIEFACDEDFGYVTSCPSNLGTGMRASVHVKIPKLTADGTDTKAKAICKPLGLSVRGLGGEHTPIGADGTIDLSPSSRLFIKERDIIAKLYEGIQLLMEEENKA